MKSRKIRCSGETDIGCLACRTRSQKCIYEPTAAMGRPRKYPRTEYCRELCAPMPPDMHCHAPAPYHQRGWPHSAYLMRSLPPHDYWQASPRNYETGIDQLNLVICPASSDNIAQTLGLPSVETRRADQELRFQLSSFGKHASRLPIHAYAGWTANTAQSSKCTLASISMWE